MPTRHRKALLAGCVLVAASCVNPPPPDPFTHTGSNHLHGVYVVTVELSGTTCSAILDVDFTIVGTTHVSMYSYVQVVGDMPNCAYPAWSLDAYVVCGPVPVFCGQAALGVPNLEQAHVDMPFTLSPDSGHLRVTFTATLYGFPPKSGWRDTPMVVCRDGLCLFQIPSPN